MKVTPVSIVYKPGYRKRGYAFVPDKRTDASIRADLLHRLAYTSMPIEQAIAIATMQLALYWCNGFHDVARIHYDEAMTHVIEYAKNFGYNINLELMLADNQQYRACSTITA